VVPQRKPATIIKIAPLVWFFNEASSNMVWSRWDL